MRGGLLDKRVTFRTLGPRVDDGAGGNAGRAWSDQFERWGQLVADRGQEARAAGREGAPQMATLNVRRDSQTVAIEPGWSVVIPYEGLQTFWHIRSVNPFDRRGGMTAMTIERFVAV
jgi:head-tail adaptor